MRNGMKTAMFKLLDKLAGNIWSLHFYNGFRIRKYMARDGRLNAAIAAALEVPQYILGKVGYFIRFNILDRFYFK